MAAWIVGAGGGGSAIAATLADAGAEHLYLTDRDSARVSAVAERLRGLPEGLDRRRRDPA